MPRHAERFESVAQWLEQQGETVVRRSAGDDSYSEGSRRFASDHPDRHDRRIGERSGDWPTWRSSGEACGKAAAART